MPRQKKYKQPSDMAKKITAYFKKESEPTICGLARELGLVRQSLLNYEGDPKFHAMIRDAKQRIEAEVEKKLLYGDGRPTGAIFWLKANGGWTETQHIELTGAGGGPIETRSEVQRKIKLIQEARDRFSSD